ncbi:unnamed protein product [Polarella glacialis]|uniref:Uncharacterized protein n=1 Tax=Polarella glacialis TaxID=89957 RepID=A0A813LRI6_POLGL|nr:unnamed protein product [Polarella glacialis]
MIGGPGIVGGPFVGFHLGGNGERNPAYVAPDLWAGAQDAEGNVTLEAWASLLPSEMSGQFQDAPGPWPTAVLLPKGNQIEILEAWYGHPSDPARRLDLTDRVRQLSSGTRLGAGLDSMLRDPFHRGDQLCLRASSSLWGHDPCPFVWKKLLVRFRPR